MKTDTKTALIATNGTPIKKREKSVADTTARNKKLMLEALTKTLGIVTSACDMSGVSKSAHYRYLADDKHYKEDVFYVKERCIDFVETSLLTQIKNLNTAATIFYLKTQAKHRGYVETKYHIVQEPATSEWDNYSLEELLEIANNGYYPKGDGDKPIN